jgi:hypothetical protein
MIRVMRASVPAAADAPELVHWNQVLDWVRERAHRLLVCIVQ